MRCKVCGNYVFYEEDEFDKYWVCISGHRFPVEVLEPLPLIQGRIR